VLNHAEFEYILYHAGMNPDFGDLQALVSAKLSNLREVNLSNFIEMKIATDAKHLDVCSSQPRSGNLLKNSTSVHSS
jgi:hypothetical protein